MTAGNLLSTQKQKLYALIFDNIGCPLTFIVDVAQPRVLLEEKPQ